MKNSNVLFTKLRPHSVIVGASVRMHPTDFRDLVASARRKFTSFVSTKDKDVFLWNKLKIVVDDAVEYGHEVIETEVPA